MSRGLALAVVILVPISAIILLCFMFWIIPWIKKNAERRKSPQNEDPRRERPERGSEMQLATRIPDIRSDTFQERPTDQTNSSIISEPQTCQHTIDCDIPPIYESLCDIPPSYESLFPTYKKIEIYKI